VIKRKEPQYQKKRLDSYDSEILAEDDGIDDFIVDDTGEREVFKNTSRIAGGQGQTRRRKQDSGGRDELRLTENQDSFQPGLTPLKGDRRYLSYNLFGIVYLIDQVYSLPLTLKVNLLDPPR
jgi:hypothetical protein